ncbi:major facilitator superfamily domain-containing protein [Phaeosphaeria sp. MPI-PUGE-AT-0046c]|nr:major facilitator superfamily domain-containing protein [Phaeosphaeria sp. MPI-PUGE-AT-0046c]
MSGKPGDHNGSPTSKPSFESFSAESSLRDDAANDAEGRHATANSDDQDEGSNQYSVRSCRSRDLLIETNVRGGTALPHLDDTENAHAAKSKPVSWRSLPRKDQLFVLTLARLSEPLTQTSLGSYLFYQLQSFDPSLPDSTISYQAGIIQAAFPFAQFLTAMLWGRFADSSHGGRKKAICIGLLGTMCSILGFGFSHSFSMAVAFRLLGGVLNGNIGVMRTMISEIIKEKKYQSRAFLLLPMTFNIGVIIGPILGGLLADPVGSYPSLFGPNSIFGGRDGVRWMKSWPYALPNLMSSIFLLLSALAVIFFLEETSELCKDKPDPGLRFGRWIYTHVFRHSLAPVGGYTAIASDEEAAVTSSFELQPTPTSARLSSPTSDKPRPILPFRRIWTRNLIITLFAHGFLAMHVGGFNSLWFIYLSTPRFDPSHPHPPNFSPHGFIHFTGGLALPPPRIGLALAILGVIGITLQIFIYPSLSHRLGTARSYRIFLALFPFTYALAPFLSRVHSSAAPPAGVSGPLIWLSITFILFIQVLARTFALPCTAILINNVSPHPSVLGTVHGIGQSVSSLTRTLGPIVFSWLFGKGLDMGIVGMAWWAMAAVAVVGWGFAQVVSEGDGHEILLKGEVRGRNGGVKRVE